LFLGTSKANKEDAVAKGRHIRGRRVCTAKLTPVDVLFIWYTDWGSRKLAAYYGVSQTQINIVRRRKCWAWLPSNLFDAVTMLQRASNEGIVL
jgi:hypothetical protein